MSPGARFLVVTAAFVIVAAGMKAAASILVPFLLALFLALICAPPLFWLCDKGVPRGLALLLVILSMAGLCFVLSAMVSKSIADFTHSLPVYQERMQQQINTFETGLAKVGVSIPDKFTGNALDTKLIVKLTSDVLRGLSAMVANVFFILLMSIFILTEASSFPSKMRRMMSEPDTSIDRVNRLIGDIKGFISLKTVISLGTGIFVALWLAVFGVDQYVLWGLLAFVLNYVPNIGSIIAAIPAVLLALVQGGWDLALWATLGYVIVNVVVGNVIEPRVMGRGLGLSSLVVLLSLVFWGWILGPVGMLLSIPLTMIVKVALEGNEQTQWVSILLGPADKS